MMNERRHTVFAAPAATLGVEVHSGALWLCAVSHGSSKPLARFATEGDAAAYQRLQASRDAFVREVGRAGI